MDKYQTRSISSNFFSAADTIDDKIDGSEADTVQVNHSEVNRGDTTSSVSLTQNPSEPILLARKKETAGPNIAPKLLPDAINPNNRLACCCL